jgi:hypothetical protein
MNRRQQRESAVNHSLLPLLPFVPTCPMRVIRVHPWPIPLDSHRSGAPIAFSNGTTYSTGVFTLSDCLIDQITVTMHSTPTE